LVAVERKRGKLKNVCFGRRSIASFLPVTGKNFKLNVELISVLIVNITQATFREIHLAQIKALIDYIN